MPDTPSIRPAGAADFDPIGTLIFESLHQANDAYTEAERRAWMAAPPQGLAWASRLAVQEVWVAETSSDLVGVMTLAHGGYVDFAYILAAHRGTGLLQRLYDLVEAEARTQGTERLWTHASLMAKPAFEKRGFAVIRPDPVDRDGQILQRFEMEKLLDTEGMSA